MRRLAVLSLHTSPLAQPGTGDGGGMNVYVRELTAALARTGVTCDVFTRAWSPDLPEVVDVEPGLRVHHVPAGPLECLPKESLPGVVEEFTAGVLGRMTGAPGSGSDAGGGLPYTSVHANYWLSGLSGHVIKHELELPLVCTFHTLDRVKAESMPEEVEADMPHRRAEAEATVIDCSDAVLASCTVEADQIASLYGGEPGRIRIVPPGVDHAFFGPGHRPQARRALGLPLDGRLLLFVGRIQPLKCADAAIETLAELLASGGSPTGWWSSAARAGRTARRRCRVSMTWPTPGACASTSTSSSPSPTSCCRRTTGPPTCASSPAAPSPSGWWRSRRPPAGRRSWPPPSAA